MCLLVPSSAPATTGRLLQSCQQVVGAADGASKRTLVIPAAGLRCWYYMSAIQDMSVLVDQDGRRLLGVCAPPDTTLIDYVCVFVYYARNQKGTQRESAALAIEALGQAFPCKSSALIARSQMKIPSKLRINDSVGSRMTESPFLATYATTWNLAAAVGLYEFDFRLNIVARRARLNLLDLLLSDTHRFRAAVAITSL